MKKDYIIFIAFLLAVVGSTSVKAQEDRTKSITVILFSCFEEIVCRYF